MTVVHQEVGAVLFRRNRILRRGPEDLERFDTKLDAAGRTSFFPHRAGDAHRRFLRRRIRRRPRLLGHFLLEDDALQVSAAIPHDRKLQLPRRTLVVQPPIDGDLFADMLRQILDPNSAHKGGGLYAEVALGTFTLRLCGTIVITSGVSIVTTSPSMPRWRWRLEDWIFTREVRKERKPGASRTRPARECATKLRSANPGHDGSQATA